MWVVHMTIQCVMLLRFLEFSVCVLYFNNNNSSSNSSSNNSNNKKTAFPDYLPHTPTKSICPMWKEEKIIITLSEKSQSQSYIPYGLLHLTFLKTQNYREGEQLRGCEELGTAGGGMWLERDVTRKPRGEGTALYLPVTVCPRNGRCGTSTQN